MSNFHKDVFQMVAPPLDETQLDAFYVACARDGIWLEPNPVTKNQLKAVTAEYQRTLTRCARADGVIASLRVQLAQSFPPPPNGGEIVNIDGGDLILPVMDGPWKGHYLLWNPALGPEKHLRYPEPNGTSFHVGHSNGRDCWWTLKDQ